MGVSYGGIPSTVGYWDSPIGNPPFFLPSQFKGWRQPQFSPKNHGQITRRAWWTTTCSFQISTGNPLPKKELFWHLLAGYQLFLSIYGKRLKYIFQYTF